jgi:hypothetical protein
MDSPVHISNIAATATASELILTFVARGRAAFHQGCLRIRRVLLTPFARKGRE